MRVLYFNNGFGLGTAKSGGFARHLEVTKRLSNRLESIIVTTMGAYSYYHNIEASIYLARCSVFRSKELNSFDRMVSYFLSTWNSLWLMRSLPRVDLVYSTSDYFCDVIPSVFYKLKYQDCDWVAMIHHLCRSPFKRKGVFVVNLLSFIFQRFSFFFIRKFAKKILFYDTAEGRSIAQRFIQKGFSPEHIYYVWNGIDFNFIENIPTPPKKYEACFAGGLRGSKGIYDLIPIWQGVCLKKPHAILYVAGEGLKEITEDFKQKIRHAKLENNIILGGALNTKTMISTLKESQIFISTSREEGWGISVCEALACGVPVVAYDLPAFQFLKKNILTISPFNQDEFIATLLRLLDGPELRQTLADAGKTFIRSYDWSIIADKDYKLLTL